VRFFNTNFCRGLSSRCVFNDISCRSTLKLQLSKWTLIDTINRYFPERMALYWIFVITIFFHSRKYVERELGNAYVAELEREMFCKGKYGQVSRSNFHDCTIYHNWKSRICFRHCYLDRAANSYNIAKGASIYCGSINRSPHAYFPRPMSNIAGNVRASFHRDNMSIRRMYSIGYFERSYSTETLRHFIDLTAFDNRQTTF